MKKLLVILSVSFILSVVFVSCDESSQPVVVVQDKLKSELLGKVGLGHRGNFSVFRFEVDSVIYIVGSEEYNGGLSLIDKIEK
jgi:hypothetical protein